MFLGLCFMALSGYGVYVYCMQAREETEVFESQNSSEYCGDYNTSKNSPDFPQLKHNSTTSVVTPRNDKDKHHFPGVPIVTSETSDMSDKSPKGVSDSHDITTTITKTITVKTKVKCGECFPKDCSLM